jgi:molybdopterin molybdotransferase
LKIAPDILLITGGVSVGDFDLVPDVLSGLETEIIFHNVAQKPAKPMLFARHDKTLVFGLPGNPVAAFLGFELYVGPLIRRMCGDTEYKTRFMTAIACNDFKVSSDREYFYPARIYFRDDEWIAEPVSARGSADICSIVNANAFARFEKGKYTVSKGDRIKFFFLRGKSYGT